MVYFCRLSLLTVRILLHKTEFLEQLIFYDVNNGFYKALFKFFQYWFYGGVQILLVLYTEKMLKPNNYLLVF